MGWIEIHKKLPTYYKNVLVELENGEIITAWLASNGERHIWTNRDIDRIYFDKDIVKWKTTN